MGDLEVGTIMGPYEVERLVGRGGFGAVYVAVDRRLGRRVALKVLEPAHAADATARQRFIDESRVAASLDHPHIIPIYDAGTEDGRPFLSMRYVPGPDLDGVLSAETRITPSRTSLLISQVASALDAAHAAGLVHRDVKPGNVLLGANRTLDHAYLTDFGLSKRLGGSGVATQSRAGQFVGTVGYVAPEQIKGRPVDGRVDVYSLGCMAYHCLAGTPPFTGESEVDTLIGHLEASPPKLEGALPGIGGVVDEVIAHAMAKDPNDRYRSCGQFAADLASALSPAAAASSTPATTPAPMVPPPTTTVVAPAPVAATHAGTRPLRRSRVGVAAVVALALAFVIVSGAVILLVLSPAASPDATVPGDAADASAEADLASGDRDIDASSTVRPSAVTPRTAADVLSGIRATGPVLRFQHLGDVRAGPGGSANVPFDVTWSVDGHQSGVGYRLEAQDLGGTLGWIAIGPPALMPPFELDGVRLDSGTDLALRAAPYILLSGEAGVEQEYSTFDFNGYPEDNTKALVTKGKWSRLGPDPSWGSVISTSTGGASLTYTATNVYCSALVGRGQDGWLAVKVDGERVDTVEFDERSRGPGTVVLFGTDCTRGVRPTEEVRLEFHPTSGDGAFHVDGMLALHPSEKVPSVRLSGDPAPSEVPPRSTGQ